MSRELWLLCCKACGSKSCTQSLLTHIDHEQILNIKNALSFSVHILSIKYFYIYILAGRISEYNNGYTRFINGRCAET